MARRWVVIAGLTVFMPVPAAAQIPTPIPSVSTQESRARAAGRLLRGFPVLLPVRSQEAARDFWDRDSLDILSSGTVLFEDKAFGANIELLSDVVGLFRVGIGVTAAGGSNDEESGEAEAAAPEGPAEEAALARLAASGGILRVTATLPLLYRVAPAFNSTWAVLLNVAGGTEAPESGGFLEDPALALHSSVELFYQRAGLRKQISFQFGVTAMHARFNGQYAEKAGIERSHGSLIVPRIGLVLIERTRVDLLYRWVRSDAFDSLGKFAVTLQQVVS